MVDVRPFRGWRYDLDAVGDPATTLCPPYDMITPEAQAALRQSNPYNVVHLEAGESLDWENPAQGQYSSTAGLFADWTSKGVLRRDTEPSYYLSRQVFRHEGREWTRLGLTACVGLEPYDGGQVLPHEYTEAPAVRDRVTLMKACSANISPIMGLYRDARGVLNHVFRQVMSGPLDLHADDGKELRAALWQISDPALSEPITRFFQDKPVFLADGHHRYHAALTFQQEQLDAGVIGPGHAGNFVMMTLVGFEDPGLLVLPYHRMLGGLSPDQFSEVQRRLGEIFQAAPIQEGKLLDAESAAREAASGDGGGHAMVMVRPGGESPELLTLRPEVDWRDWGPLAVSEAWILEEKVLRPVLGDATLAHLGYIHSQQEAADAVASGGSQLAFLLRPFPMAQFETLVTQRQRLPRKSTFFYPKLPTGLVINQLDGNL